ncbi:Lysophospholipase L2 [Klebsiella pneumoniae IS46]|nr:Lysophospholipase L2 [Klebsiella pneumoniae IS46]
MREGMLAGDEVLANVEKDTAPTLLLQAEEERVVDNLMHDAIANYGPLPAIPVRAVSRSSLKGHIMRSFLKRTLCAQSRSMPSSSFSIDILNPTITLVALLRG